MLQGQLHDFEVLELTGASHGLHVAFARRGVLLHGPFGAPLKGTHAIPECPSALNGPLIRSLRMTMLVGAHNGCLRVAWLKRQPCPRGRFDIWP